MLGNYKVMDAIQASLGAFISLLPLLVLRAGSNGPYINPTIGFFITIFFLSLFYYGLVKVGENSKFVMTHIFINFIMAFAISSIMTVIFGITTFEEIKILLFGSPAMIFTWVAFPIAMIFDLKNIVNILKRYDFFG